MAPTSVVSHHHRSTTKTTQKPFKSRFSSKGTLKDQAKGKVEERRQDRGKRRTPHQQVMSKIARKNQARQQRLRHHERKENEDRIFQGSEGAPKHVAILPLSTSSNTSAAVAKLNESVDVDVEVPESGTTRVKVDRFRRNLLYIPSTRTLLDALDTCRLADWVIILLSVEEDFDETTEMLLRSVEGQGVTNVIAVVQGLEEACEPKKRPKAMAELRASIGRFFPDLERIYSLDSKSDCSNLVRSLCTASTRGIRWRDRRSWMLIESVERGSISEDEETSEVTLSGIIRGKGLNLDRLVHVPGWGDFQIGKLIETLAPSRNRKQGPASGMEDITKEHLPSTDKDDVETLAPEEVDMIEASTSMATHDHKGVLLDDHHYFSDDDTEISSPPKRLPKGTSAYQAAWYLDDVSDSGSDLIDDEDQDPDIEMTADADILPGDELTGGSLANGDTMTEVGASEYSESEMHLDRSLDQEAEDLTKFRESRKKEEKEDLEFPDEIELHPETLARERLSKYRGLKSLRTSEWNTEEDALYEPSEYRRLLGIADYRKSSSQAVREALAGGISPGTRVKVTLLDVPLTSQTFKPLSMFSLLRHEHKHTFINLNMTLHSEVEDPIKSKEELIVQIGPRRFIINPLFSAPGATPNDVHKFDRFLHPGGTAIATFMGPLTWGANPVLVFKRVEDEQNMISKDLSGLQLIANATTIAPSHSRVIAKRVILTGHPYKINKKLVTIRYMFFNREDVTWFSALPLWTKRGRQGLVKDSLGTHGYFKATFDAKINPLDAVAVSLYKRVWPRPARLWEGDMKSCI
ncbi:MAG: hypothetical protein Q9160_004810 [Pyrenula sp. 1 TL-2023]